MVGQGPIVTRRGDISGEAGHLAEPKPERVVVDAVAALVGLIVPELSDGYVARELGFVSRPHTVVATVSEARLVMAPRGTIIDRGRAVLVVLPAVHPANLLHIGRQLWWNLE